MNRTFALKVSLMRSQSQLLLLQSDSICCLHQYKALRLICCVKDFLFEEQWSEDGCTMTTRRFSVTGWFARIILNLKSRNTPGSWSRKKFERILFFIHHAPRPLVLAQI